MRAPDSTRIVTDGTATMGYNSSATTSPGNAARDYFIQKFTGMERDTETGLDFFQARYMGSAQGRFMSADPSGNFVASTGNPQSWNMFSYVLNNPFRFVDPSGRACVYSGSGDLSDPDNYYDDDSGGQNCGDAFAAPPQQTTVSAPFSSAPYSVSYSSWGASEGVRRLCSNLCFLEVPRTSVTVPWTHLLWISRTLQECRP